MSLPAPAGRPSSERDALLHTVVVGGGPTGVEFAGELSDFIGRELYRIDPDRARDMRVWDHLHRLYCKMPPRKRCTRSRVHRLALAPMPTHV